MTQHRSFLIKPASWDCNLACDYCFYKQTAETYPDIEPHRMSDETYEALVVKGQIEGVQSVSYIWQGGEPMLMGLDFYKRAIEIQEKHKKPGQMISNTLQTNGVLVDDDWAEFLAAQNMLVGISVDGPQNLHDTHRFDHAKKSAYDKVFKAIELFDKHKVEYNILSVVTSETVDHAKEIYRFFREKDFHYLQFIDCIEADGDKLMDFTLRPDAYGKFLCELFDEWFEDGYPYVSIRLFDNILQYRAGMQPECCMYKNDCGAYYVIEYNGDIYPCDFFVEDDWLLGNVHIGTFDDIDKHPKHVEFTKLRHLPHDKCEACEWFDFCQRGCIKSRAFPDDGYESLNYLCKAYKMLFEHTDERYEFLSWDIIRRHRGLPAPQGVGRNDQCPCGSGKKYKKCCEKYEYIMKK